METNLTLELRNLKQLLVEKEITLPIAIDKFFTLLELFQNGQEEEILLFDKSSSINQELIQRRNIVKERIKKLNRIILLQELGIKFSSEEINTLLSR